MARINPRWLRDFAHFTGMLAKTDSIDAKLIALGGKRMQPALTVPDSRERHALKAYINRRRQLTLMITMEQGHAEASADAQVKQAILVHIRNLKAQINALDKKIALAIEEEPERKKKALLLTSVPGIGKVAASVLIAELPKLGSLNPKQSPAMAALTPVNRDSGAIRGKRMIQERQGFSQENSIHANHSRCHPL